MAGIQKTENFKKDLSQYSKVERNEYKDKNSSLEFADKDFITNPIIYKDDSNLSKIESTYNFLMQVIKPNFNFTVKFYCFGKNEKQVIDAKKLNGYNDDKVIDLHMDIVFVEQLAMNGADSVLNYNRVREDASSFMKQLDTIFKDKIGKSFPWKFIEEGGVWCEETGFKKAMYKCLLKFESK